MNLSSWINLKGFEINFCFVRLFDMKPKLILVSLIIGIAITFLLGYIDYETPSWSYLFSYFFTTVDGVGAFVSFTVLFSSISYLFLRILKYVSKSIMRLH